MATPQVAQKIDSKVDTTKSAAVLAQQIIADATEDHLVTVTGTTFQKLETVVRYLNRDKIQARGEVWYNKNLDFLVNGAVDDLIRAREKAIVVYLNKKDNDDKRKGFVELLARGVPFQDAVKQSGYNPDMDTEK